jgi:hypothetical protein
MIPPRQSNRGPLMNAGLTGRSRLLSLHAFKARLSLLVVITKFLLLPWLLALWHRRSLQHQSGPAGPITTAEPVVISTWYGNEAMLTSFLDHHRGLGLTEFVFLDLSLAGQLAQFLADQESCAVWRPHGEWDPATAIYWLNYLRRHYGTGRWVLSLEPCDLLVFHRCETRRIADLLDFLASERRDHVYGLIMEMYGEDPATTLRLEPGENPLSKLAYFDPFGYQTLDPGPNRNVMVRGGLQRRTVYAAAPRRSPALNRIPLVRWRWYYAYVAGTRLAMPRRLNTPHSPWHSSPTVCLLRFALLDDEASLAAAAQVEGGCEIVDDDGGRSLTAIEELRARRLKTDCSMCYGGTEDLVACGLLNPGQWF